MEDLIAGFVGSKWVQKESRLGDLGTGPMGLVASSDLAQWYDRPWNTAQLIFATSTK